MPHVATILLDHSGTEVTSYRIDPASHIQRKKELKLTTSEALNDIRLKGIYSKIVITEEGKINLFFANPRLTQHEVKVKKINIYKKH